MPRTKAIFAMITRVKGKNVGKKFKRYFGSEAEKSKSLANYAKYGKGPGELKRSKSTFELGRDVNIALPHEVGLKPTEAHMKQAAKKLGITKKEAWRAWTKFTW